MRIGPFALMPICFLVASASSQVGGAPTTDPGQLAVLAPHLAKILQIAAVDPALAVAIVPDPWIDSLVAGALAVEAEVAVRPPHSDPPKQWPIGPWPTPVSLAGAIEAVDVGSVVALYQELKPRLAGRCRQHGASVATCDRAMRVSGSMLSAGSVLARAADGSTSPITPSQRELARLGVPVVTALRDQMQLLGIALWGPSWGADR